MDSNVIFPQLPTYVGAISPAGLVSLAVTVGLPVLAGMFMRSHWSAFAKGFVLLGFAAVKAFIEAWIMAQDAHRHFEAGQVAYSVGVSLSIAILSYVGFLRGTKLQQAAINGGVVQSRVVDGTAT